MTRSFNRARESGGISGGCVLSIVIVIVLVIGGGYFVFKKSMGIVGEQAKVLIRDDPEIRKHLGEIQEMKLNLGATGVAPENQGKDGDDDAVLVFDVTGTKGSGEISLWVDEKRANDDELAFTKGRLRMKDGTTHDIDLTKKDAPKPESAPPEKPGEKPAEKPAEKKDG